MEVEHRGIVAAHSRCSCLALDLWIALRTSLRLMLQQQDSPVLSSDLASRDLPFPDLFPVDSDGPPPSVVRIPPYSSYAGAPGKRVEIDAPL